VERFPNGTIQPDPVRFPSGMKALSDYAHSKSLKFGVYTAQGSETCQSRPGAFDHEALDGATYCEWGLDYLKNDNCMGQMHPQANTSWIRFKAAFDKCFNETHREIVTSVEYCKAGSKPGTYGPAGCGEWVGGVANLWRTTRDVLNTWESVMSNIHNNNAMANIARPGHFNDPDMLQVGNVGLTVIEQYSHMSLWCIAGAPLLAGTDIIHASNTTLDILANPEVTAIDQDLGLNGAIQGIIVSNTSTTEVWRKLLANGDIAVALLNLGDTAADITAVWKDIGFHQDAAVTVRDLWKRQDLQKGVHAKFTAEKVPSHGTVMLRLSPHEQ